MKKIHFEGENKTLRRMAELLNRKPEIGEGHEDAYHGDLSKEAYDHSQLRSGNPHRVTLADLGIDGILDKIDAIILAIGMESSWITHRAEIISDHDGDEIRFHGVGREQNEHNYLLWH